MNLSSTEKGIKVVETNKNNSTYAESIRLSKNTEIGQTKRKRKLKLDPHLDNFEVRLKKKRKIFAKAEKLLDQIRQTGDPNVAAFLQLALERLNAEEDLVKRGPKVGGTNIVRQAKIKKNKSKVKTIRQKGQTPSRATVDVPETTTAVPTVKTTSSLPKSRTAVTAYTRPSTFYNSVSQTTQQSTVKPSTKIHITNISTVPQTTFLYEELTTEQPATTTRKTRKKKNRRRKKGKANIPKRRLRQKWFQENVKTTTPLPTKDPGEAPEIEILMTDNMITSIVDKVTEKLMGKMTGEIKTLKSSINSIKSTIIKKKSRTGHTLGTTSTPLSPTTAKETLPTDINRSLINEISSNVLTKLSGVSWLEQKSVAAKTAKRFDKPSKSITQLSVRTSPLIPKTAIQLMARPTKSAPVQRAITTRKPVKPRIVGSWMSALPPALSMQLFAVESVPTTKEKIVKNDSKTIKRNLVKNNSVSTKVIPRSFRTKSPLISKNDMNKGNNMEKLGTSVAKNSIENVTPSGQDSPFHVNTIVPLSAATNVMGVAKQINVPEKSAVLKDNFNTYSSKTDGDVALLSRKAVNNSPPSQAVYQTPLGQSNSGNGLNVDSLIAKISQSVLGEVNKKLESFKLSVGGQSKATTRQPTTAKSFLNLDKKIEGTAPVQRSKPSRDNKLSAKTKTEIVKQISEAVIRQLSSQVKAKAEQTTRVPITVSGQEHEPEGQTTRASVEIGGSSGSLVDKISSKVFGKMNAKLDALSNTVNNLKHTLGRQELEEIPPELLGGLGQRPMSQNFGKMSIPETPNMAPTEMIGLGNGVSQGSSPKRDTQSSSNAQLSWTAGMNPWINMRMPNQYAMWGGNRNTRSPWWE